MHNTLFKSIAAKTFLAILLLGVLGGLAGCDPYKRGGGYGHGGDSGGGHGH